MLTEITRPQSLSPRPESFAALMELYEANYIRLRQLCPDLHRIDGEAVSRVSGCLDLHLQVLETSHFTSTVLLTYYFPDAAGGLRADPNVVVRMYHDAHQAEVLSRVCRVRDARVSAQASGMDSALLCKWRLNRFLYKWLGYCRLQGHCFGLANPERRALAAGGA
ncbi:MAG TPA: DUF1249 domain-containing protein [Thioalkalivibrio sp.]|mgnify:CR=1 FL=1|nr:DUF1249 domain-containing protein [Thioalkalivibrio sp.]